VTKTPLEFLYTPACTALRCATLSFGEIKDVTYKKSLLVGVKEGILVGIDEVGLDVGRIGCLVGVLEGENVGVKEGCKVGFVGEAVGIAVG